MRIVVHGQQAFGKSVLEALLERGEDVVAVYCAPDPKQGGRLDPLKEAALARQCTNRGHFVTNRRCGRNLRNSRLTSVSWPMSRSSSPRKC
jgi:methionyl-tRNA formyltransferase